MLTNGKMASLFWAAIPFRLEGALAAFTLTDGLNTWELTVAPTPITEGALAGVLMLLNIG